MARRKKTKPDDRVVISRVHRFLTGDDNRHYASGFFLVDDINSAQIFRRDDAEALLARGRWHGLDPKIEEALTP